MVIYECILRVLKLWKISPNLHSCIGILMRQRRVKLNNSDQAHQENIQQFNAKKESHINHLLYVDDYKLGF